MGGYGFVHPGMDPNAFMGMGGQPIVGEPGPGRRPGEGLPPNFNNLDGPRFEENFMHNMGGNTGMDSGYVGEGMN